MNPYHQPLIPGESYHLFSRAVGNENLFLNPENYRFFLHKFHHHTNNICDLYCYSLLPNHFHLVVRIKVQEIVVEQFQFVKKKNYEPLKHDISDFIMERFSNFLNSYTKAFNKFNNRKGALFVDYMKRSKVNEVSDFTSFIWYVHKNAVHHYLAQSIGDWRYDSYHELISDQPTTLLRNEVIDWFGSKEAFIKFHQQTIELKSVIGDV